MKFRAIAATVAAIVGLVVFSASTTNADLSASSLSSDRVEAFAAGRYIVKTRRNATPASVLNRHSGVRNKARTFRSAVHGFAAELTAEEVATLSSDEDVLSIVLDPPVSVTTPQSRSTVIGGSNVWGVDRTDQRELPLNQGFTAATNGTGVTVYVVDTGIRTTHDQFTGRVLSGYVAPGLGTIEDCDGHGTHVSGTAVGSDVGIAPGANVVPVRVLDCDGNGYISDVISGLEWIIDDVTVNDRFPAVANLSLGGDIFAGLDNAVNDLISTGVSVVVAAGNEAQDACNVSPARTSLAITVAASTISDVEASFSNYGNCVDMFAPGTNILSAWYTSDTDREFSNGTSMATPHVAGVVALYLETNTSATPADVWNWLRVNSTGCEVAFPTSRAVRSPNRLLYSGSSLGKPCPPSAVAASVGDSSSVVSWSAPEGFSGTESLTFSVSTSPASSGCVTTAFSCSLSGLTNGQQYMVSVTASNTSFTSATAATTTVTPEGVPIAPTISGVAIGNATATVSWGSVPSTSTVTYTATAQPGGQSCSTTQLSCAISGLTNGATYTFSVVVSNVSGAGGVSAGSIVTMYTTPPPPTITRIRTSNRRVTLSWGALDVPYAVTYTGQAVRTKRTCTTSGTSCTVGRLVNGKRYRLNVTATNVVGIGQPSVQTAIVVPGINVLRSTIKRKRKVLLSKFITTLSAGRKTYTVTKGACKIASGKLVAPRRPGSCTLRLSVSASGVYPSMYNTVKITVT